MSVRDGNKKVRFSFSARNIAVIAVTVALLIGGQFALSFVAGVEIVTLLLCAFCFVFGVRRGVITAFAFALLRCFVFGFDPSALLLYVIYYPLFALISALCGKLFSKVTNRIKNEENGLKRRKTWVYLLFVAGLTAVVCAMTCGFTMLDNVITPLMMGFGDASRRLYIYNSLPTMAAHVVCVGVEIVLLFLPVHKIFTNVKESLYI